MERKILEILIRYITYVLDYKDEMYSVVNITEFNDVAHDLAKLLIIPDVSKQRELLIAYEKQMYTPEEWHLSSKQLIETIDLYISNL